MFIKTLNYKKKTIYLHFMNIKGLIGVIKALRQRKIEEQNILNQRNHEQDRKSFFKKINNSINLK